MTEIEKKLEGFETTYFRAVQKLADTYAREVVAPVCKRHGLFFIAGMGSWCFYTKTRRRQINLERLSKKFRHIHETLSLQVLGNTSHFFTFGEFLPDCVREETR